MFLVRHNRRLSGEINVNPGILAKRTVLDRVTQVVIVALFGAFGAGFLIVISTRTILPGLIQVLGEVVIRRLDTFFVRRGSNCIIGRPFQLLDQGY